ncbi:MAG: hypothetical protein N2Z73_03245 [Endomicrobia bacterium]|nr:hypothetical protein [Endomicrobiia bacterium]
MFYFDGFDFKKEFPELYGQLDVRNQGPFTDPELIKFEAPINDYNIFTNLKYRDFSIMVSRSHYHENNTRGEQVRNYVMNRDALWAFDKDIISFKYNLDISEKIGLISSLSYDRYVVDPKSNYKFWWGDS